MAVWPGVGSFAPHVGKFRRGRSIALTAPLLVDKKSDTQISTGPKRLGYASVVSGENCKSRIAKIKGLSIEQVLELPILEKWLKLLRQQLSGVITEVLAKRPRVSEDSRETELFVTRSQVHNSCLEDGAGVIVTRHLSYGQDPACQYVRGLGRIFPVREGVQAMLSINDQDASCPVGLHLGLICLENPRWIASGNMVEYKCVGKVVFACARKSNDGSIHSEWMEVMNSQH